MAKTTQRFNRIGQDGQPKKLSARAQRYIQGLSLENGRMSAASITAGVEGVGHSACQCSDYTASMRTPLLKTMHKKAHKQFADDKQTKDVDHWNHVPWSDETCLKNSAAPPHKLRKDLLRKERRIQQIIIKFLETVALLTTS